MFTLQVQAVVGGIFSRQVPAASSASRAELAMNRLSMSVVHIASLVSRTYFTAWLRMFSMLAKLSRA